MRIAHLINPAKVSPTSDLYTAQPITFESMRRARDAARGEVEVRLLTTQYPEDHEIIPDFFEKTPDLERSVLDLRAFPKPRKLPLIHDIIDRLRSHAGDADYLIYTNADIALMPHFYLVVKRLIERQRHDALIVNRRTIPGGYDSVDDLQLMYAEAGQLHPGFDCAVFTPQLAQHMELEGLCVGIARFYRGICMILAGHAERLGIYRDLHLTFHIGNDMVWRRGSARPYSFHNMREYRKVVERLERTIGPVKQHPVAWGMFLETTARWLLREWTMARLLRLHEGVRRRLTWLE